LSTAGAEARAAPARPVPVLGRVVDVREGEAGALLWAFAYFLTLLLGYYLLRPIREEMDRPAQQVLFTVVTREEKYKAKTFIDTFVYRGGDTAAAWLHAGLAGAGLALPALSLSAVPFALASLGLALWLARRERALEARA